MFQQITGAFMGLFLTLVVCRFMNIPVLWAHDRQWVGTLHAVCLVLINALLTFISWVALEIIAK